MYLLIYFVFYSLVFLLLECQFYFVPSCFLSLLVDFVVHSKYFYVSFLLTKSDGGQMDYTNWKVLDEWVDGFSCR